MSPSVQTPPLPGTKRSTATREAAIRRPGGSGKLAVGDNGARNFNKSIARSSMMTPTSKPLLDGSTFYRNAGVSSGSGVSGKTFTQDTVMVGVAGTMRGAA